MVSALRNKPMRGRQRGGEAHRSTQCGGSYLLERSPEARRVLHASVMRHSTVDLIASIHRNGIVRDEVIGQRLRSLLVVIHVGQDGHKKWKCERSDSLRYPCSRRSNHENNFLPWMAAKKGPRYKYTAEGRYRCSSVELAVLVNLC